jgi:hypothetical protein
MEFPHEGMNSRMNSHMEFLLAAAADEKAAGRAVRCALCVCASVRLCWLLSGRRYK